MKISNHKTGQFQTGAVKGNTQTKEVKTIVGNYGKVVPPGICRESVDSAENNPDTVESNS